MSLFYECIALSFFLIQINLFYNFSFSIASVYSSIVGAIAGKQGHGLFVTTSRFSQKAKDYADNHHIILVDGVKLANLMIKHNFCVSTRKTFEIKTIDTDALLEYQDE
ncbi:restriction endonuclease [Gardnerella leopoldii]|uniref:restriction endonuclease n=1 Tax=Gardnerella TaxID=2701 RepID=UPI0039EE71E3